MSDYVIIVDGDTRDIWPSLKEAKGWADAGNYDYARDRIEIAKIVVTKKRNQPIQPQKRWGEWKK